MDTYNYNNELRHSGILGMRWGVRRYRNKDGSLTPDGKKRYDKTSDDAKEAAAIKKKKVSQMSNSELRKLNERQTLERNHAQLNKGNLAKTLGFITAATAATGTVMNFISNNKKIARLGEEWFKRSNNSVTKKVKGKIAAVVLARKINKSTS